MNSPKVAIYARQSLEKKESLSIEDQIDICKKQAEITFGEKVNVHIFKESKSGGGSNNRPEFLHMMEQVRNNQVSVIIVYKLDRISRNLLDFCTHWEVMKEHGVQFISCSEKFDTATPMGEAMLMITIIFAQMERNAIIERVTDNYFSRAEKGFYLGGYAPFGLDKIDIVLQGKKTAGYIKNDIEADVLRFAYETYTTTNISLGKLSAKLTEMGVKGRRGNNFDAMTLSRIMRSPLYVRADAKVYAYLKSKGATINNPLEAFVGINGCYIYAHQIERTAEEKKERVYAKKRTGRTAANISNAYVTIAPHEGFIDSELWITCQAKLDNNKQVKCDRSGTHTWLSGIMRCQNCGYGVTVSNNNQGKTYINCYGRRKHLCNGRKHAWQMYEIEDQTEKLLLEKMRSSKKYQAHNNEVEDPKIKIIQNEIVSLEQKSEFVMEEIMEMKALGQKSGADMLRKKLDTIGENIKAKHNKIGEIINKNNIKKINAKIAGKDFEYILANWNTGKLTMKEKQAAARTFIEHVIIGDEDITVVFC